MQIDTNGECTMPRQIGSIKIFALAIMCSALQSTETVIAEGESGACDAAMESALELNAYGLLRGAKDCAVAEELDRASFLILAGQIRAMTDLTSLEPDSEEEEVKLGELYGTIYYHAGGSGDDEIYRDRERSDRLFGRLRDWSPSLNETYDPGWAYKRPADRSEYFQMIACQKAIRLEKLNWYAGLVRDDDYFEATRELEALRAANPGSVLSGSEIDKQKSAISSRIDQASAKHALPDQSPEECAFADAGTYEPDPNADFVQLYAGANGPSERGASSYQSKNEIIASWIARSLSPDALEDVLNQIDFDNQILVHLSFGMYGNATGRIHITDVDYSSINESIRISGIIGINENGCEEPNSIAYPFALAVAPRPEIGSRISSTSWQTFSDGCKPAMNGSPASE
jgi:hypothetical protein